MLGVLWPNLIGVGMYFAMMLANDLRPVSYGFATHWSARADLLPLVIWCVAGVLLIGAFILAAKRCAWALCAGLIVGLLALPIVGMVLAFISCSQPDGGK